LKLFTSVKAQESVPIEQAFERYYPAIFRYFRFRGADADTASDLASSTFERVKGANRETYFKYHSTV
jgi:DNA-directed RNA polymerase specialized sigma24 family protein